MMDIHVASALHAAVSPVSGGKSKGPRPSVLESHHGNVNQVLSHLRELGHNIDKVESTDYEKTPNKALSKTMARSVIHSRSGPVKHKTVVRTAFNTEGGDHNLHIYMMPDDDGKSKKTDKDADEGQDDASE